MNWPQQVWHVFRRDLRRTWMLLALYIVCLALAAGHALDWPPAMMPALEPAGPLLVVIAMLAVTHALLMDVTTRADAFWAITPVESSAVMASKVVYLLLLIGTCAGVTLATRAAWELGPLTWSGGGFALMPQMVLLLLGTALVASTFGSFRGVALVAGVVCGSLLLFKVRFVVPLQSVAPPLWWSIVLLLIVGCMAGVAWRYHRRSMAFWSRGMAVSSGVLAMLFPLFTMRTWPGSVAEAHDPKQSLDSVHVALPITTVPQCVGQRITVPLSAAAPRGWRLGMLKPTLHITRDDGSTLAVPANDWMQLAGGGGPMLPTKRGTDVRVLGGDGDIPRMMTGIVFVVPAEETARTCGHIARLESRMWLITSTGIEVLRVPLQGASSAASAGYRGTIRSAVIQDSSVAISVRLSGFTPSRSDVSFDLGAADFALFNPVRGELVRLNHTSDADVSNTLVLPGHRHWAVTLGLEVYERDRIRLSDVESWRANGVLLVIEPREEGRGWATVRTTAAP